MDEKLLEKHGWTVECESPLEIRHEETGSFASLLAADMVIDAITAEDKEEKKRIRGIEHSDEKDDAGYFIAAKDQFGNPVTMRRLFSPGSAVICKYADDTQDGVEIEVGQRYTVSEISAYHGQPHVYLEGLPRVRLAEWRFTKAAVQGSNT